MILEIIGALALLAIVFAAFQGLALAWIFLGIVVALVAFGALTGRLRS
jgi:VIT1/CCC1 family predicted Fe2+/Mn2+ transporter